MESSLEDINFSYLRIWKSQKIGSPVYLTSRFVVSEPPFFVDFLEYDNIVKSWKVEDEEWPEINFPLIESTKSLDMNFSSIKKHEAKIW